MAVSVNCNRRLYQKTIYGKGGVLLNDTEKTLSMLQEGQAALKNNLPGVMEKFMGFAGAVLQEGILSKKEKELIAVAVAVGIHCQP